MQNRWRKTKLKEVAKAISGFAFKSSDFIDEGIPVVKIANIKLNAIEMSDVQYVNERFLKIDQKYHIKSGDVLISLTGSHLNQPNSVVGRVARYPNNYRDALLNQRAGKFLVDTNKCDAGFLFYLLSISEARRLIALTAHGAANQANISPGEIGDLEINIPNLSTQGYIASILSAYDDLIENNKRRITILEAMAKLLYREWIVEFNGPGVRLRKASPQEKEVTGKDVFPEGWEVKKIGDILANIQSGSRPKGGIDPNQRGIPSIGAENVIGLGQYDYSKDKFVSQEFSDKMTRGRIQSGDVLLYKDGAQIGRKSLFRDGFPYEDCCINEHVFILRSKIPVTQHYLFFWLDRDDMTKKIQNLNVNAAQPGINQAGVQRLPIVIPCIELIRQYEEIVEPQMKLLFNLAKKSQNLRQIRDLLLPKLVSGEIEV
jgi:type I restriction enzyme S subunit